ncbi:hypothetical protein CEXT_264211 [Caerostris extrusa]|uniref:Uncharacterized protein n=1 Tax=Caerostris extrusa TaxID=172846 RepID=A0AAV4TJ38_CAEEX|nr:hypothetical protein CEXT_264211 [Caerostris extrusa]
MPNSLSFQHKQTKANRSGPLCNHEFTSSRNTNTIIQRLNNHPPLRRGLCKHGGPRVRWYRINLSGDVIDSLDTAALIMIFC